MASQVEICRLALSHIADAARITSIDPPDNSIQAQHAATFYPIARDKLLAHDAAEWSFAKRRVALTDTLIEFEDGEWAFAYAVPADYIRAIKVCPPGVSRDYPGEPFIIESDASESDIVILTNVDEAVLHYIYREEETGRYTPSTIVALSYLLGSYLAGPILKGRVGMQVKQALQQEYDREIRVAAAEDMNARKDNQDYSAHSPSWVSDR